MNAITEPVPRIRLFSILLLIALAAVALLLGTNWTDRTRDEAVVSQSSSAGSSTADPELAPAGVAAQAVPSKTSSSAKLPFLPLAASLIHRENLPLMEYLLTPRSAKDQTWMASVGYPRLEDIEGSRPTDELQRRADSRDIYAANVLAARLYREGNPAWREVAQTHGSRSPFLSRLLLEHELTQPAPERLPVADFNRLALRTIMLGDTEIALRHRRQFGETNWMDAALVADELRLTNELLSRAGRPTLPAAIRATNPDRP